MNSSPDSSNPSQSTSSSSPPPPTTDSAVQPQSLIERFAAKHTSKIPIPVLSKSRSRQNLLNGDQQHILKAQIRDSINHSNGSIANNSKVDQIIADLLIEALNHSTDIGIEFIKAPKKTKSQIKLNQGKRTNLNSRRTNGIAIAGSGTSSGGKRSSHGSAKYQQVFDAIPEEKSGSLSIESPNEGNATQESIDQADFESHDKTTNNIEPKIETNKTIELSSKINGLANNNKNSPKHQSANGVQMKVASGKAAIESDQDKSETWFGCFGRTHVDSPVDGLLMDEGIFKVVHSTSLAV